MREGRIQGVIDRRGGLLSDGSHRRVFRTRRQNHRGAAHDDEECSGHDNPFSDPVLACASAPCLLHAS